MSSVDTQIDELYKAPLQEFVQLRATLVKTLSGEDARRVKALTKPTLVPWAVNQLYWRARPVFDRLTASGARLRAVQIAGLEGRPADVHRATEAHRQALTDAINQATALASRSGARPDPDALTQTLEALSLSSSIAEPGRLTKPLRPAGFEALTGVTVRAPSPTAAQTSRARSPKRPPSSGQTAEERRRARLRAAAERRQAAALREGEANLKKAQAAEVRTRHAWERAREDVEKAERALAAEQARSSED